MNNAQHVKTFKKRELLALLDRTSDKRRRHELYLCTCYFAPDAARKLINEVVSRYKVAKVHIYIDRRTAIAIGAGRLSRYENSFKGVEVRVWAVESPYLFHSKSYLLASFDENFDVYCGSLVIGSANLTGAGLTSRSGNIECLLDTQDPDLISEHIRCLKELNLKAAIDIEVYDQADEFSFKYALIQEGAFLHKWNDTVERYFSTRYRLSEKGRATIKNSAFEGVGFALETATISKSYFVFDYAPTHLEGAENLVRNFGIETYLGHWIPLQAIDSYVDMDDLGRFKEALFSQLESQYSGIAESMRRDYGYLIENGLIEAGDVSPVELFERRVADLKENDLKLKRMFSKHDIFELPYGIEQIDQIIELFDEMLSVSESRKQKNKSMKSFLSAYFDFSVASFRRELSAEIELTSA